MPFSVVIQEVGDLESRSAREEDWLVYTSTGAELPI